jgi:phage tail-like protein
MARSIDTDFYHDFRFHVVDPAGGNLDPVAGFTRVSIPDLKLQEATYREGVYVYTRKYPGVPTIGNVQLQKGVVKKASDFYAWIQKPILGGQNYRSDLIIQEYHISDEFGINGKPSRTIRIKEVFPVEFTPSPEKQADKSDVSIQGLTLAVEEFDIDVVV